MDFSAWFEVFLDGRWYTMDARYNHPRVGRIVMGRGRDAADVAISTSFGVAKVVRFEVVTDEQARLEGRGHVERAPEAQEQRPRVARQGLRSSNSNSA